MKKSREELRQMADFMSAFLFIRIPLYMVEYFIETNDSSKLKKWITEELKPGSGTIPSQIIKSAKEIYM